LAATRPLSEHALEHLAELGEAVAILHNLCTSYLSNISVTVKNSVKLWFPNINALITKFLSIYEDRENNRIFFSPQP
jgi:hypothetical protein